MLPFDKNLGPAIENKHFLSKPERLYFERSFVKKHRAPTFYIVPKVQKNPVNYSSIQQVA